MNKKVKNTYKMFRKIIGQFNFRNHKIYENFEYFLPLITIMTLLIIKK